MTMKHLLDNITWHTLAGPHAKYAAGAEDVRRYAQGFSPILGFADPGRPDFATLARYCEPGEHFYSEGWSGATPAGWRIDAESTMFKMIWEAQMPATDEAPDAVPLGPEHAAQALELATLTRPGPFGLRTIELGEYFGYFDGQRLVAMAGERMQRRDAARDQRGLHASGLSRPRSCAQADAEAGSPPDAARRNAVPACHAREQRRASAV